MKLTAALICAAAASAQVRTGTLPAKWITGGPNCIEVPDWQVHAYNEDFYILRESGCTNYEKPFLYLIFGKDKALLEDTGAGKSDAARVVADVIAKWSAAKGRGPIPLIVAHSHAHGDHVAGDAGFRGMPNTTMVPLTVEATREFFAISQWPDGAGQIDLGDRILDVIPIPGHDTLSIAFYDRQTGILLTGDSLYPGRLYVRDFPEFVRSTNRLVEFTRGKTVTHILGTHIEQSTTPYKDYPVGTKYQPEEHELALSRGQLLELAEALAAMNGTPTRLPLRDFTIWPQAPRQPKQ
ncbi:MAG TPA: MBL fold metallo-hydrolase [Candidatus Sulfopaludibacter sp.]|jgi:glyoxylase-like metal-dependent hydrolase (beta-lactamase superfamily II)|nr:MBL fold metallo-hydrolase [Candidatus Sulfopaludibacter sp.]